MSVKPIPDGYHTVTPYLVVESPEKVIEFVTKAFGAQAIEQMRDDKGITHAEVRIGDSVIMMGRTNDNTPAMPCMLYLYMENVDEVFQAAVDAGGTAVVPPMDMFYGDRSGGVSGPCGNQWWIATHIEDVPPEEMQRRSETQWRKNDQG